MSSYDTSPANASVYFENVVTVAKSLDRDRTGNFKVLTKQILPDNNTIPFSNAYLYNFYPMKIEDLNGLYSLVKRVMANKRCCILRSEPRQALQAVRRLFQDRDGAKATLLEFPQNWFAIDIDNWNVTSGDIKQDASKVLLALGWQNIECFAVATSSYGLKPGINLRLFLWNHYPIDCNDLKAELADYAEIADPALFHPIQPIYVAPPIFIEREDPIKQRLVFIEGEIMFTTMQHKPRGRIVEENKYSRETAKRFEKKILMTVMEAIEGERHNVLRNQAIFYGKLVAQGHFEFEHAQTMMVYACDCWRGKRDRERDAKTIYWGLTYGVNIIQDKY